MGQGRDFQLPENKRSTLEKRCVSVEVQLAVDLLFPVNRPYEPYHGAMYHIPLHSQQGIWTISPITGHFSP